MKADLHVHSRYSRRPSEWILQKLGCPESFTDPLDVYRIAKRRGMSPVTITDHNCIDGCLEIGHLSDTFISEEVTAYFPEDGCKIHVLVYDIDEEHHREIGRLRENVGELTAYLQAEDLVYAMAHPFYPVNGKLTVGHFEKCLLLFRNFELNGARSAEHNAFLEPALTSLSYEFMVELEERHGITPGFDEPWKKNFVGGSDDHSSLTIAQRYTEVGGAVYKEQFLRGIKAGKSAVGGVTSNPKRLARTFYSIAYQFYHDKFGLQNHVDADAALRFLDGFLGVDRERPRRLFARLNSYFNYAKGGTSGREDKASVLSLLRQEAERLVGEDPLLCKRVGRRVGPRVKLDQEWFRVVNQAANRVFVHFADHVADGLSHANFINVFQSLGSAGALYSLLAPYFVSFSMFADERRFAPRMVEELLKSDPGRVADHRDMSVGHFTDTFYEVNGVSGTLKKQIEAARANNRKYTVITCADADEEVREGVKTFRPLGAYELSMYPEQKIFYPPVLEMLDYCYEENFTHIHAATPGPLGLAALAIARILKLPLVGTYHTAIPQYARYLTGDHSIEELAWKYVLWFYDQLQAVYVPSQATAAELAQKGIGRDKLRVFPRGVDLDAFNPSWRSETLPTTFPNPDLPKLLYVGRISREKNLSLLVNVFQEIVNNGVSANLIIVGDGPYRSEMEDALSGFPCVFTGYLEGEELAAAYASCDLFVFPSTTDTFGNVVLEAQASGIPVVVSDCGGPQENMVPGITGMVVRGNDEQSLYNTVAGLLGDPRRLASMGSAARRYAEERSFEKAFEKAWEIYAQVPDHGAVDPWPAMRDYSWGPSHNHGRRAGAANE